MVVVADFVLFGFLYSEQIPSDILVEVEVEVFLRLHVLNCLHLLGGEGLSTVIHNVLHPLQHLPHEEQLLVPRFHFRDDFLIQLVHVLLEGW